MSIPSKYWGNIQIKPNVMVHLSTIYKGGYKFVDLGCGTGNILKVAKDIGYDVTGVELDEELYKFLNEFSIVKGNIEDLPDNFYKKFNVIYSYLPLKVGRLKYINKIIKNMSIGAYLILGNIHVNKEYAFLVNDDRLERCVHIDYFKKI